LRFDMKIGAPHYSEDHTKAGLWKTLVFNAFVVGVTIATLLSLLFEPRYLTGFPWDATLGGILLLFSPLALTAGALRKVWAARLLQARPVVIERDALVFPTASLRRSPRERYPWAQVRSVSSSADLASIKTAALFSVYVFLTGGRVLVRPYYLADDSEHKVLRTVEKISERVPFRDLASAWRESGRRPPTPLRILLTRILAVTTVPFVMVVVFVIHLIGWTDLRVSLIVGSGLLVALAVSIPLWLWSVDQRRILGRVSSLSRP